MGAKFSVFIKPTIAAITGQSPLTAATPSPDGAPNRQSTHSGSEPNTGSAERQPATPADVVNRPRPAQTSVNRLRTRLTDIPADLLDKLGAYLPAKDLVALASTSREINSTALARLLSLRCADDASTANTREQLQAVLRRIQGFPSRLRTEPLRQVMLRICTLPLADRADALRDFNTALEDPGLELQDRPTEQPRPALLYPDARSAVSGGENVAEVAAAFRISSRREIFRLEKLTFDEFRPGAAGTAVRTGENVLRVAQRFGITTPRGLRSLEAISLYGFRSPAAAAMKQGGNVLRVAERFGISSAYGITQLELLTVEPDPFNQLTAYYAVARNGENVRQVVTRFGISTPYGLDQLARLERSLYS